MSPLTDATTVRVDTQSGESHNAKLYLEDIDQGAISTLSMPEDGVGLLDLGLSIAIMPVESIAGKNYTEMLSRDDRATVQLPTSTFRGTVHFEGHKIPVEGTIQCDLEEVHILGTNQKSSVLTQRDLGRAIKKDVVGSFETIAVTCYPRGASWINCGRFNKREENGGAQWCIDVCWDPKTQTVSRNYVPREPVETQLALHKSNTEFHLSSGVPEGSGELQQIIESNTKLLASILPEQTTAYPRISLTGTVIDPIMGQAPRKHSVLVESGPRYEVSRYSRQLGFGKLIPQGDFATQSETGPSNIDS